MNLWSDSRAFCGMVALSMMLGSAVPPIRYRITWPQPFKFHRKSQDLVILSIFSCRWLKFCWLCPTLSLNWGCFRGSFCKFFTDFSGAGRLIWSVFCMLSTEGGRRRRTLASKTTSFRLKKKKTEFVSLVSVFLNKIVDYFIKCLVFWQWFEVLDGLLGPWWKAIGLAFNCTFLLFGSVIQLIACARSLCFLIFFSSSFFENIWTMKYGVLLQ